MTRLTNIFVACIAIAIFVCFTNSAFARPFGGGGRTFVRPFVRPAPNYYYYQPNYYNQPYYYNQPNYYQQPQYALRFTTYTGKYVPKHSYNHGNGFYYGGTSFNFYWYVGGGFVPYDYFCYQSYVPTQFFYYPSVRYLWCPTASSYNGTVAIQYWAPVITVCMEETIGGTTVVYCYNAYWNNGGYYYVNCFGKTVWVQ